MGCFWIDPFDVISVLILVINLMLVFTPIYSTRFRNALIPDLGNFNPASLPLPVKILNPTRMTVKMADKN